MTGIETDLIDMAKNANPNNRQLLLNAASVIADLIRQNQEFREANDRLRRENKALHLDIYFLDKTK